MSSSINDRNFGLNGSEVYKEKIINHYKYPNLMIGDVIRLRYNVVDKSRKYIVLYIGQCITDDIYKDVILYKLKSRAEDDKINDITHRGLSYDYEYSYSKRIDNDFYHTASSADIISDLDDSSLLVRLNDIHSHWFSLLYDTRVEDYLGILFSIENNILRKIKYQMNHHDKEEFETIFKMMYDSYMEDKSILRLIKLKCAYEFLMVRQIAKKKKNDLELERKMQEERRKKYLNRIDDYSDYREDEIPDKEGKYEVLIDFYRKEKNLKSDVKIKDTNFKFTFKKKPGIYIRWASIKRPKSFPCMNKRSGKCDRNDLSSFKYHKSNNNYRYYSPKDIINSIYKDFVDDAKSTDYEDISSILYHLNNTYENIISDIDIPDTIIINSIINDSTVALEFFNDYINSKNKYSLARKYNIPSSYGVDKVFELIKKRYKYKRS